MPSTALVMPYMYVVVKYAGNDKMSGTFETVATRIGLLESMICTSCLALMSKVGTKSVTRHHPAIALGEWVVMNDNIVSGMLIIATVERMLVIEALLTNMATALSTCLATSPPEKT
uniref:Uncharacterized protein n=1 Tax=Vibrio tasmaniensis TaxID=212663 RepID=A0A0H3ZPI9_9VIBR|nr:hypothetical protein [Vibrio tasmaniensis]